MAPETLPKAMLACQVVKFNEPYVLQQVPVQQSCEPFEMLLKTAVASFCHTDIMVQTGVLRSQLPITASHEGTGTVVALGSAVRDFKIGDRVISGVIQNRCGHCEDCNSLHTQYCSCPKGGLGVRSDGAFAEYFLTDSREASHVPDELNFTVAAPLACAGISVWRGLLVANLNPGEWLGMVGSGGGLGHLGTLFAKAQGLHVVGINAREQGLELSKEVGADVVLDARQGKESVIKSVLEATNGKGVSATLNVSDAASAASLACAITKRHGKMIQIAQPPEVNLPFSELVFRDIKIEGSMTGSRKEVQEMLQFVAKHGLEGKSRAYYGLKDIPNLVKALHSGQLQGKGIVIVDKGQV